MTAAPFSRTSKFWQGKVVVITGASEGIGAGCARLLEKRGVRVALLALRGDGFESRLSGEPGRTSRVSLLVGQLHRSLELNKKPANEEQANKWNPPQNRPS
jgi:NAD(P)-dependent dehydrogenase (short-subunit alcohol dehydrogenase family)